LPAQVEGIEGEKEEEECCRRGTQNVKPNGKPNWGYRKAESRCPRVGGETKKGQSYKGEGRVSGEGGTRACRPNGGRVKRELKLMIKEAESELGRGKNRGKQPLGWGERESQTCERKTASFRSRSKNKLSKSIWGA